MKTKAEIDGWKDRLHERVGGDRVSAAELLDLDTVRGDFDLDPQFRQLHPKGRPLKPAAVLVPIVDRDPAPTILLTLRPDDLPSHAGQVAFPGGKLEEHDEGPFEAALREAEEEVGLDPDLVTIVGHLDTYETGTGFRILPVISIVKPDLKLIIDEREVAEAFEVPFSFLMDPANHERHSAVYGGRRRHYYAMPYEGYYIWGATAGMLVNLYDTLYG